MACIMLRLRAIQGGNMTYATYTKKKRTTRDGISIMRSLQRSRIDGFPTKFSIASQLSEVSYEYFQ